MFPVSDVIPSKTTPFVTVGLIILNSVVFLYEFQLSRPELQLFVQMFGVIPADFTWGSVVTSMFLHEGWMHLIGNMLYLWIFGDNVEDAMGRLPFVAFYLSSTVLAAAAHAALHSSSAAPLIGASGAVAAVMGVYFVLYPRSQVLTAVFLLRLDVIEVPAIIFLGAWLGLQLLTGLVSMGTGAADGGLSIGGYVAGFAVGAAAGLALRGWGKTRAWG